ncbi:MAG: TonB-dependent receptor [Ignavibacteriales bacterium]|nr:TonB-dependent receptor [Ignavibacteriales bacterium]
MKWLIALCALILVPLLLLAGTTGKIAGKIVDKATNEPLVGANVVLVGTTLGASADVDGSYVILNIPPGAYTLRVTMIGYSSKSVTGVRVIVDQTTTLNVTVDAASVQLSEVVIQAERPLIQKDLTATSYIVTSEQMSALPVKNFIEVLNMQAGVVAEGNTLYVRGGRGNEVAFLIDGMYVNDPVMGGLATRISNESIEELNFLSGTFNAEYGNALSGVVNIVTKEGGKAYSGTVEARTSEFGAAPYKDYRENRVDVTMSGPLFGESSSFFVTGERDARSSWLPFGSDKTLSTMAKLSGRFVPALKGTLTWRYSEEDRRPYNHSWKYIPDQYLRVREKSRQIIGNITHSVADNLFYDVRVSYFNQSYYSGVDKDTSQYLGPSAWSYLADKGTGFEFYAKRDPIELTDNRTATLNAKGDLVWQMGKSNEVKLGFEFKKHDLKYFDVYDPKRNFPYITDFTKKPFEGVAYVQDKIEMNAFVMNLGLRFDYADQLSPFRNNPLDQKSVIESRPKLQWSPRLGVAHPISDKTSLHFSYGHFFQNPDYTRLYENSQYDINVREPIFGQPNLDAERTTAYEVGVSHQFSDAIVGSFTAYYKDVIGLVGTRFFPPFVEGRFVGYTLYMNEAYANMKGFEMRVDMRRTKYLSGSITYTYSVAKGSASSETEDYPGTTQSTLLYPLSFDKPHLFNLNANLYLPDNDGPALLGIRPLANTVWNVVVRASSGYPYTPAPFGRVVSYIEKNSARMPMTYSVDAQINKQWLIGKAKLTVFVELLNLTNHKNVLYVYSDTGEPDASYSGGYSQDYIQDPSNFGPPRRIRLGARFGF